MPARARAFPLVLVLAQHVSRCATGEPWLPTTSVPESMLRSCELHVDMTHVGGGVLKKPFVVPRTDEYVGAAVCKEHNWSPKLVLRMRTYIRPGSTVVDAGGNLGAYAVQFSHWTGPNGKVRASRGGGAVQVRIWVRVRATRPLIVLRARRVRRAIGGCV